jgi:YesN/AraC family two-component response regulator
MLDYLIENYSRPVRLKELADALQHNVCYLCALFSRRTGRTFHRCLDDLRLARAQELLGDPLCSVCAVAYAVGYTDANYFRQAFKAHTGISPTEWRRRLLMNRLCRDPGPGLASTARLACGGKQSCDRRIRRSGGRHLKTS